MPSPHRSASLVSVSRWWWTRPASSSSATRVGRRRRSSASRHAGSRGHRTDIRAELAPYRIADNQTATIATWDEDKLPLELVALQEAGFDLNLTGFSAEELQRLLALKNPLKA